jgi:Virulence-associated protein E
MHKEGEPIEWEPGCDGEPLRADGETLRQAARETAAACLFARYWPKIGGRHDAGLVLGGFLARTGMGESRIRLFAEAVARAAGADVKHTTRCAEDAAKGYADGRNGFGLPAAIETFGEKVARKIADWLGFEGSRSTKNGDGATPGGGGAAGDHFVRGDQRQILKTHPGNVALAIAKLGVSLKFNEFSGQTEISGLSNFGPELNDAAAIRLRFLIHETFGFLASDQLFEQVLIDLARAHSFHPVRDWLASLEWDRVPRIDDWIVKYGGAEDTRFCRAVGRIFLVAGVRRIRRPGCKFDTMLVLESRQGLNKSKALRALAMRDEWFTDNLPLDADSKEVIEQTRGIWIAEFAELSGIGRRDVNHVKNFLSKQEDRARPAYGRRSERAPRQFVTAGTTNDSAYLLNDENRRFWPVAIKKFDIKKLADDAELLWAEAAYYEGAGESIVLNEDLWKEAAEQQDARRVENPYEDVLREKFGDRKGWIKSHDVWDLLLKIPIERRPAASKMVGQAMRVLGFTSKQIRTADDSRGSRGSRYYERGYYERGSDDCDLAARARAEAQARAEARPFGGVECPF